MVKSINFIKYSLKNVLRRQCLQFLFLRYCCLKTGQCYHAPSGVQRAKGLEFQWKTKKQYGFCWNYLKKWLTYKVRRFWIVFISFYFISFQFFFILFNPSATVKIKKLDSWYSNSSTNSNNQKLESHKCNFFLSGFSFTNIHKVRVFN